MPKRPETTRGIRFDPEVLVRVQALAKEEERSANAYLMRHLRRTLPPAPGTREAAPGSVTSVVQREDSVSREEMTILLSAIERGFATMGQLLTEIKERLPEKKGPKPPPKPRPNAHGGSPLA